MEEVHRGRGSWSNGIAGRQGVPMVNGPAGKTGRPDPWNITISRHDKGGGKRIPVEMEAGAGERRDVPGAGSVKGGGEL